MVVSYLYAEYVIEPWLGKRQITLLFVQIHWLDVLPLSMVAGTISGAAFGLFAWSILPRFRRLSD